MTATTRPGRPTPYTCPSWSGHRVFTAAGAHVECDGCGRVFTDPDNTGGLPPHDRPEPAAGAASLRRCAGCGWETIAARCPHCGADVEGAGL